jgi:NAD(P)H-flavin reductase
VFIIRDRREVAPNVHEFTIEAPEIARKANPGQFVILMVDEKSERVPYTLADWDPEEGTINLVVLEAGQSSRKLILCQAGDAIEHVVGPLGVPLAMENYGTVVLTAGCYGIGAILNIARGMKAAGNRVIAIVEARSEYVHYYGDRLAAACDEFIQTTIDGSNGTKGHAVRALHDLLEKGEAIDMIIAVGCPLMMMSTGRETAERKIPTLVALNPIMLDGTGMCGACRVSVGGETRFACVDGPFFDAHAIDWGELFDRKAAYAPQEVESVASTAPAAPLGRKSKNPLTFGC